MPGGKKCLLVLSGERNRTRIVRSLEESEFRALFFHTMEGLLGQLHAHGAAAVLADRDQERVDVLELILNVRDISRHVPVLILGPAAKDPLERHIAAEPGVIRLSHPPPHEDALKRELLERLRAL